MTVPNTAEVLAIEVTLTATITMTPAQAEAYAREHSLAAPVIPPVARDVLGRLEDAAVASYLESEHWIGSFTTVTSSPPKLRAVVIV
jgi:hypothetical protein